MKRLFILFLGLFTLTAHAKTMRDIWLSMPDSLLRYVDQSKRRELLEYLDIKADGGVKNLLEGMSRADTLTTDYLRVEAGSALEMQLKRLPTVGGDSVVCLVRTYKGPAAESLVQLYTQDWTFISEVQIANVSLVQKPDTMSDKRFLELQTMLEPLMVSASLSAEENILCLQQSLPLVSKDEYAAIKAIVSQRKFKWNGKTFK